MKTHAVLLLVQVPGSLDFMKMKSPPRGFDQTLSLIEAYAFLQQTLSGNWQYDDNGIAQKNELTGKVTSTGSACWIKLELIPIAEILEIPVRYASAMDNDPQTEGSRTIATFNLDTYPGKHPLHLKISIELKGDHSSIIYTFK